MGQRKIRINTQRLHEALEASGMNRTDLSRRAPLGYNTTVNIFRGDVQWIRIRTMERLASILNLEPGDFYTFEEEGRG